jgi:hypothetical protein
MMVLSLVAIPLVLLLRRGMKGIPHSLAVELWKFEGAMTMLKFLLALLLSLPVSTDSSRMPDVQRFCRKLMDQGDFTILACLKENRPKLSAACRYVLVSHGQ